MMSRKGGKAEGAKPSRSVTELKESQGIQMKQICGGDVEGSKASRNVTELEGRDQMKQRWGKDVEGSKPTRGA